MCVGVERGSCVGEGIPIHQALGYKGSKEHGACVRPVLGCTVVLVLCAISAVLVPQLSAVAVCICVGTAFTRPLQ